MIVPTLHVRMPALDAPRGNACYDALRRSMHYHAERGNDQVEGAHAGLFPAKAGPTERTRSPVGPALAGKASVGTPRIDRDSTR